MSAFSSHGDMRLPLPRRIQRHIHDELKATQKNFVGCAVVVSPIYGLMLAGGRPIICQNPAQSSQAARQEQRGVSMGARFETRLLIRGTVGTLLVDLGESHSKNRLLNCRDLSASKSSTAL